jgi:membrane protease YdiL (CAAX protease family)
LFWSGSVTLRSTDPALLTPARSTRAPVASGSFVLFAYIVALAAAEWLLSVSAPGGSVAFGCLVLALLGLAVLGRPEQPTAGVLPVLTAVTLLPLVAVAIRPAGDRSLAGLAAVTLPTLVAVLATVRVCPREWIRLRPDSNGWAVQFGIVLSGVPLGLLAGSLLPDQVPAAGPAIGLLVLISLFAAAQEVLFRGLLVPAIGSITGRAAVPAAAAIYGLSFVVYGLTAALSAVVLAIIFGECRRRTGSIVGVVGAHITLVLVSILALHIG